MCSLRDLEQGRPGASGSVEMGRGASVTSGQGLDTGYGVLLCLGNTSLKLSGSLHVRRGVCN